GARAIGWSAAPGTARRTDPRHAPGHLPHRGDPASRPTGVPSSWARGRAGREVTRLKGEVARLQGEVTRLRGEVTRLRGEVTRLRGEIRRRHRGPGAAVPGRRGPTADPVRATVSGWTPGSATSPPGR